MTAPAQLPDELIERAARAAAAAGPGWPWDELSEHGKNEQRDVARAVLAAAHARQSPLEQEYLIVAKPEANAAATLIARHIGSPLPSALCPAQTRAPHCWTDGTCTACREPDPFMLGRFLGRFLTTVRRT